MSRALTPLERLVGYNVASDLGFCDSASISGSAGVFASCVLDGELFVGGLFNMVGNVSSQNLARWDGAQWHATAAVGPVITPATNQSDYTVGLVTSLVCDAARGRVWVGGYFSEAGGVAAAGLALYDPAADEFAPVADVGGDSETAVGTLALTDGGATLVVGGYFSTVGGVRSESLALLDADSGAVLNASSAASAAPTNGAVFAVAAFSSASLLFGGVFSQAAGDAVFMVAALGADGISCVRYADETDCDLPVLCCQGLNGPVYAIEQLSDSVAVAGGSFGDVIALATATGFNATAIANVCLLSVGAHSTVFAPFANGTLGGGVSLGTDGAVFSTTCVARDGYRRCEELVLAGEFTQVVASAAPGVGGGGTLLQLAYPAAVVALGWSDDSGDDADMWIRGVRELVGDAEAQEGNTTVMTTTLLAEAEEVFFGGVLPEFVNAGAAPLAGDGASTTLPAAARAYPLGERLTECVNNVTGGVGAAFCCPTGAICPVEGLTVPCPLGWGLLCVDGDVDLCPAHQYCPTPGDHYTCPEHSFCQKGVDAPTRCAISASCSTRGLSRPSAGFLVPFAVTWLAAFLVALWLLLRGYVWLRDLLRAKRVRRGKERVYQALGAERADAGTYDDFRVDLDFEQIGVELRSGLRILKGVTGRLQSTHVTAVMGPSGCGKTTFLSAMSNRISDGGKVLGKTFVNGRAMRLSSIQHLTGFVPQEDTMHRDLTVAQTLYFAVALKSAGLNHEQRHSAAKQLLVDLDLVAVRHTIIGDEATRGVSGGQRKRVNVGIELAGSPRLLLLDEPTSGLDSTGSEKLIRCLKDLATAGGLTVAMVIHQPRVEVLNLIDDVVLLAKGGYTVYTGARAGAVRYLASLGRPCPEGANPSDFFLDVITENPTVEVPATGERVPLAAAWAAAAEADEALHQPYGRRVPLPRVNSTFFQTAIMLRRSFVQQANNAGAILTDFALLIAISVLIGCLDVADQQFQLAATAIGLTATISGIRVYGPEQVVLLREASAGVSTLAYFLGKMLSQVWLVAVSPLVFLSVYYPAQFPSVPFGDYYVTLLASQLACSALGYFVSNVVSVKNAQIAGVTAALVALLFAGSSPSAAVLADNALGRAGMWLSYARWCMAALYIKTTQALPKAALETGVDALNAVGYTDVEWTTEYVDYPAWPEMDLLQDAYRDCLWHLVWLALLWNAAAFAALTFNAKRAAHRLSWTQFTMYLQTLAPCRVYDLWRELQQDGAPERRSTELSVSLLSTGSSEGGGGGGGSAGDWGRQVSIDERIFNDEQPEA